MSHFTVLVVDTKGAGVDNLLEPFEESPPEGSPYCVFNNKSTDPEIIEEYNNGTMEAFELNGKWFSKYNKEMAAKFEKQNNRQPEPKEVPIKEVYPSFELAMQKYFGYNYSQTEKAYGYYSGKNPKWDWYVVGGRWDGMLKVKGRPDGVNQAYANLLDFDAMDAKSQGAALKRYNKVMELARLTGQENSFKTFESLRKEAEANGNSIDTVRATYWNQPLAVEFDKLRKNSKGEEQLFGFFCTPDEYVGKTEEEIKKENLGGIPFAMLVDGVWYEKGQMGWFGMSDDKMTQAQWSEFVRETLKKIQTSNPMAEVTMVDCHV